MKRDRAQPLNIPTGHRGHEQSMRFSGAAGSARGDGILIGWLQRLLHAAGRPPIEVLLWDGRAVRVGDDPPRVRLRLLDRRALIKLLFNPDLEFGELYTEGRLQIDGDLIETLEIVSASAPEYRARGWLERILAYAYLLKRNTLARARDNIHHHYDLGNEFYRLWLDERMIYTCAYYAQPDMTLERAQTAKLDHVCRKLRLRPGERVVEAGCGWGALALHMARHYGVTVTACNISREQLAFARERARTEGLEDRVEFIEADYREIDGRYDAFVSVGMLEHVTPHYYHALGEVMHRVLPAHGRGLIHSIGRNRPQPMNAWIERRIFPGAYPPTLSEMAPLFEPWKFSILDVENLRLHYAQTLRHWLERFEQCREPVETRFGDAFIRAWRLYLAGSMAAFKVGELQLFQVLFARHDLNTIPATRDYLYCHD